MATRFTNSDFTTAARKLGEKVFEDKEQVVKKEVKQFADKLIDKYVPKPLIGALNEYSEWFVDRERIEFKLGAMISIVRFILILIKYLQWVQDVVCLYLMKITLKPKESKIGKAVFLKKEIIM